MPWRTTLPGHLAAAALLHCAFAGLAIGGPALDTIDFGDAGSERSHNLEAEHSESVDGALGARARKLLPRGEKDWQGGRLTFRMAVDPEKPTYFTAKFWGGDVTGQHRRLMLFIDGKQIGHRHLGAVDPLDILDTDPRYPGRFFYKTLPLPVHMTKGRRSVTLAIHAEGSIWGYGPTFERYQHSLEGPSRGIYRGYTHTTTFLTPGYNEPQGEPPRRLPVRPSPGPEVIDEIKRDINKSLQRLVDGRNDLSGSQTIFLARGCLTPWTVAHHDRKTLNKVVRAIDQKFLSYAEDPTETNNAWEGAGDYADAVRVLGRYLERYLDHPLEGSGMQRRAAWLKMFRESRDVHTRQRRAYTNQSMAVDIGIYRCNRAVAVLAPEEAWPEDQALKYLYESAGIEPWSGSVDKRGRPSWRLGKRYFQTTEQGLTRELGFVGGYGELPGPIVREMYESTRPRFSEEGDPRLKAQLNKIAKARAVFRYPLRDSEGNRSMRMETVIGWRDWHYPYAVTYVQMTTDQGGPFDIAAETMDPELIGYCQQMLDDNQYFLQLKVLRRQRRDNALRVLLRAPGNYEKIKSTPAQPYRLPMSPLQPNFVFADAGVGAVAIKQGDEILYASLYWRSRYGVNGLARVHHLTPNIERDAVVRTFTRHQNSGLFHTIENRTNAEFNRSFEDRYQDAGMEQSMAGQRIPIAKVPSFIKDYKPGRENFHAGKATYYQMTYGPYCIAMNCSYTKKQTFNVPDEFLAAVDLTDNEQPAKDRYSIKPRETVVLYRGN